MRASVLFLLAALLCGLVGVCAAGDQPRQISSSRFDSVAGIVRPDGSGLVVSDRADAGRDPARDGDVTCYTVQSYRVKRQSADSDVVEPAGYSTCQRSSRYSLKTTEESGKASSR
jgi:hypothetical protein